MQTALHSESFPTPELRQRGRKGREREREDCHCREEGGKADPQSDLTEQDGPAYRFKACF